MSLSDERVVRLDTPRDVRPRLVRPPTYDPEAFGRFAERAARFIGTARFLAYMTVFIVIWLLWNVPYGPDRPRFDPYPFIFLTFGLSMQASYAAPLILLAQNRQEARDRISQEQDRDASLRHALGEVATRDYLRSELRSLLSDLDERGQSGQSGQAGQGDPTPDGIGTHP